MQETIEKSGRAALVTGAGRGIGRAIATALADDGWDVGVNYCQSEGPAREVCDLISAAGRTSLPLKADVGNVDQIAAMFAEFLDCFGKIDLLVNNAGITKFQSILETTPELWDEITNTDWKGAYFCTQQAAREMIKNGTNGVIVNITSVHQVLNFPIASVYGSTKAALNKFTQHAALELAPHGIRVNAIAPGYIKVTDPAKVSERGQKVVTGASYEYTIAIRYSR